MLNSIVPRHIKQSNLSRGTWFLASQYLPPEGVEVLCCDQLEDHWFDIYSTDYGWSKSSNSSFAWQVVSNPITMFWELD